MRGCFPRFQVLAHKRENHNQPQLLFCQSALLEFAGKRKGHNETIKSRSLKTLSNLGIMARLGRSGFLAAAVLFHLIYIYSIFDIYFVSPIVHGMRAFRTDVQKAPAKRLVLFVGTSSSVSGLYPSISINTEHTNGVAGDGLRADKAFQSFPDPSPDSSIANSSEALEPRPLAPYLRSRVLSHGTFGVSHTRVPTESRPGHVALIAGLYEDVSAVATGWKLNPVNFDSVFNRSRHTWSWGSPDILPMFKEGAVPGRIDTDTYPPEVEDFTSDATQLDTWVFDRVKKLFQDDAPKDAKLDAALRKDKNVFFLHLLGLDTTGHGFRPYSKEYLYNIKVVDKGVQEIAELIESFYDDGQTAFVFTADHGMSDWGSHGDGHPDNTRTPLIAWGSGVAKPQLLEEGLVAQGHEDGFASDWGLQHVPRHDVAQADIAALMAELVGLEYPTNSVGELPLAYLDTSPEVKAKAMLTNAREILEQYRVKEEDKQATEINYQPFGALSGNQSADARIGGIEATVKRGQYGKAIEQSIELNKIGLQGMRYLQTYDWLFLRVLVTAGYLGWIAFSLTTAVDLHVLHGNVEPQRSTASVVTFSGFGVGLAAFLFARSSPWRYYLYALFPLTLWEDVFSRRAALAQGKGLLLSQGQSSISWLGLAFNASTFVGILEALVSNIISHFSSIRLTDTPGTKLFSPRSLHNHLSNRPNMALPLWNAIRQTKHTNSHDLGPSLYLYESLHCPPCHQNRKHNHDVRPCSPFLLYPFVYSPLTNSAVSPAAFSCSPSASSTSFSRNPSSHPPSLRTAASHPSPWTTSPAPLSASKSASSPSLWPSPVPLSPLSKPVSVSLSARKSSAGPP